MSRAVGYGFDVTDEDDGFDEWQEVETSDDYQEGESGGLTDRDDEGVVYAPTLADPKWIVANDQTETAATKEPVRG